MKQSYNNKSKNKTFKTSHLEKSNTPYTVVLLNEDDIPDILALQQKVFDALPEEQKSFILPKSPEFFEQHFEKGDNAMLGIFVNGDLIAQSIILNPSQQYPSTGMVDMETVDSPETLSIIEGVLVDADYRGNNLMQKMVDHWLDYVEGIGRTHVIAEIAVDNPYSWGVFLEKGMTLHSMGTDPDDGTVLYNAHETIDNIREKELSGTFNYYAKKKQTLCDEHDLKTQKELMDKGYKGVAYNRKHQKITMAKK